MKLISSLTPNAPNALGTTLRFATGTILALLLGACASMSEKECLSANWTDQGYRDGRDGQPLTRLEDHREACAKVGVIPDTQRYRAGRDIGIREYCTPANGIEEGRRGRPYRNACPINLERDFLANYDLGYGVYQAEQRVDSLDRDIQRTQRTLDKEKSEAKRRELRHELRRLDSRLSEARRDLRDEAHRLRRAAPRY